MAYNEYDDDSFTSEDRKLMGGKGKDRNKAAAAAKRKAARNAAAAATATTPTEPTNKSLGTLDYKNTYGNYGADELPEVTDPEATLAGVLKDQHERFISNFRDYETAMLGERNDTSLVDSVEGDVSSQSRIAHLTLQAV